MNIKIKKKQSDTSLIYKREQRNGKGEQNRASEASLSSTKSNPQQETFKTSNGKGGIIKVKTK